MLCTTSKWNFFLIGIRFLLNQVLDIYVIGYQRISFKSYMLTRCPVIWDAELFFKSV